MLNAKRNVPQSDVVIRLASVLFLVFLLISTILSSLIVNLSRTRLFDLLVLVRVSWKRSLDRVSDSWSATSC